MRNIKTGEGQALVDIAMEYCGDALRVFELADLNNISVTQELQPGTSLIIPDSEIDKIKIIAAFTNEGLHPASKEDEFEDSDFDGVDYWIIEEDFIVQ